ncbi:MAG: cysteine desulfurase NifS [Ruminococcaceae bacterium]|nr:cysteine desulfurase NifS [Oscillospiraceae bacterium]
MEKRFVYADNSATTRVCDEAVSAMMPFFTEEYGNPSSIYPFASESKKALEGARKTVADILGAIPDEIIFTGGGTEADNHAICGVARANIKKGRHIVTSAIEHHAVLHTFERLKREGFEITYVPVDENGVVTPEALSAAVKPGTTLVSIMAANNEIGTIQPIAELARIAHEAGAVFHTDAVQAAGHIAINVREMGIDMLSLSGHKFNGPKGVGLLYVKKGTLAQRFMEGGGQEKGRRSGTENVAGIVGMAKALEISVAHMEAEAVRLGALRKKLEAGILAIPHTRLTGHPENRLPGLCSCVIEYIEGESLVLMLGLNGICASTGSACSTGSLDPSHVLMAIGLPHEVAHGSLRLSLGRYSTEEDVDYILEKLPEIVKTLRAMSPVWPGNSDGTL